MPQPYILPRVSGVVTPGDEEWMATAVVSMQLSQLRGRLYIDRPPIKRGDATAFTRAYMALVEAEILTRCQHCEQRLSDHTPGTNKCLFDSTTFTPTEVPE